MEGEKETERVETKVIKIATPVDESETKEGGKKVVLDLNVNFRVILDGENELAIPKMPVDLNAEDHPAIFAVLYSLCYKDMAELAEGWQQSKSMSNAQLANAAIALELMKNFSEDYLTKAYKQFFDVPIIVKPK